MQAAKPNPTQATPVHKVITDKPIIKVPGCPPIAEVMTGVITYMLTFDRIPELDRQGRPKMFYSQRIHDKCYRRPHFDAGQFVEAWDDESRAQGLLPLQGRLQGPDHLQRLLHRALERGHQLPDPGRPRLHRLLAKTASGTRARSTTALTDIHQFGIEANADKVGGTAAGVVGAAVAAHAAVSAHQARHAEQARPQTNEDDDAAMGAYETQGFKLDNTGRRIVVDPVTRIEGHMRCEVNLDKNNVIRNAVSTGTMWRGLEVILKGRDPRDAWAFVERICGVCTGCHALTSVRAVEDALGHQDPEERAPDPRDHGQDAAGARPRGALLPPACARLGRRRSRR